MAPKLVLASQSVPRKLLLERLKIPFTVMPSAISEDQMPGESPMDLVERLSVEKALTVAKRLQPDELSYIIIGSDQVAMFNNTVYGKPGDYENAFKQLKLFNNQIIEFITGLCLVKLDADGTLETKYTYEISSIKLRNLTDQQIENYLHKDQPYQCAASFKIEGLGISLAEQIDTRDFNAIIGLPMIQLIQGLKDLGLDVLTR